MGNAQSASTDFYKILLSDEKDSTRWNLLVDLAHSGELDVELCPTTLTVDCPIIRINETGFFKPPRTWLIPKDLKQAYAILVEENSESPKSSDSGYKAISEGDKHIMIFRYFEAKDVTRMSEEDIANLIQDGFDHDFQDRLTVPWRTVRQYVFRPWATEPRDVANARKVMQTLYPDWEFKTYSEFVNTNPNLATKDKSKIIRLLIRKGLGNYSLESWGISDWTLMMLANGVVASFLVWLAYSHYFPSSSSKPTDPICEAEWQDFCNSTTLEPDEITHTKPLWDELSIMLPLAIFLILFGFGIWRRIGGGADSADDKHDPSVAQEWLRLIFAKFGSQLPAVDDLWSYLRAWADDRRPEAVTSERVATDMRESIIPELVRRVNGTITPREAVRSMPDDDGDATAPATASSLFWRRPSAPPRRRVRFNIPH